MKVFVTRVIASNGLQMMREAGLEIIEWREKRNLTQEELIRQCQVVDILVSAGPNKLDEHFFSSCRHLKLVALHAVGFDNVEVLAANSYNIPVANTPGVLSKATADTAFLLMQMVARKAQFHHHRILRGEWNFFDPMANLGIDLYGKTLGIFGLGNIGMEMARLCQQAFGMFVIYHNRSVNPEARELYGAQYVSFDELLTSADILSVHASLNDDNRGIFDQKAFAKMKENAIFINTARGGLHDEKALFQALEDRTIWGAGLDVTNPEPMSSNNPMLKLDNIAITPHIGTTTIQTREAMSRLIAENVILASKSLAIQNPIGECLRANGSI